MLTEENVIEKATDLLAEFKIERLVSDFINGEEKSTTFVCPKCKKNFHIRNFSMLTIGWCETDYCYKITYKWGIRWRL